MSESENYFTGKILNLAFQTSAISMALLRYADNIVIEANDTFFSMFEIVRKELIGNSLTGLGLIEKKDWDLFMFTLKETGSIRNADINYRSRRNTAGSALISFETIDSGKEKFILITLDNITDHKSIEKQLNDYESRYQDVFEHMSEGIAYCKMLYENGIPVDWLYISVNKSFESLTGLKDAAGKKVSEVIPGIKEKDPEIFEIYSRVSLTGKSEKLEFYVSALGQWFHLSVYSSEKEHFVAIFDVITERKLTEESLVKKESLLSAGLKLACLGYWEYDAMIDEFTFNDQLYSILHTTTEKENGYQMSSKAFSKKFIHPDDVQFVIKQIEQTSETIDPGYSHQFEHRVIFGDGGTGYVSVSFFVSKNERGGSIKTFGVMQDITDRRIAEEKIKESEEKFRQLAENIDVVFWLTDWVNKKLLYVNPSFEKMYGLSVESAYENRLNWLESLHPEDKEGIRREFNTQAGMGEPAFAEYRIIREDGTIHWILDRNFPIKDNSGKVYRIVSFAEDITEQKRYENELKDSKEHAERSDKLKDAFIANISHEIKTPLNGILGMTGLIRNSVSKYLNNEEKEFFNAIDWASARIIRTIDMILNFSRLQVGDFPVKPVRLNLTAMIQNLINEYTLVAGRKELLLTFENNAGHFELLGDEYCIGQALSNLIENAIKYTTKGGVKIELSLSGESDLILKVQDSGIGITEEYLPHIFEPYSQEEIGYNRGYEGVGLGMSLVKRYLELNKAIITVQSRKNAGTVFTIIFSSEKIIRNEGKNEAQDIMGRLPSEVHSIEIEKPSVLIVEDDSINLLYIRSVLKKRYRVEGVYTASRALAALRIRKFNLILMDISLKGEMNGLELTRKLKADPEFRQIPVIAVTGHTSPQDKQNCMNAGCDEFLPKPFSDMELLDRIEIFLKA